MSSILNSDGIPCWKSSKFSIWPIQLILNEIPINVRMREAVVVGLWFGQSKPNMKLFLYPFVNYMNQLSLNGINCKINDDIVNIKFDVICCCADSPARADMQGIHSHSGYFSCNWCLMKGSYVYNRKGNGSVKFPMKRLRELPEQRNELDTIDHIKKTLSSRNNKHYYGLNIPHLCSSYDHSTSLMDF